jgi:inositol transport system substrate-binding protein
MNTRKLNALLLSVALILVTIVSGCSSKKASNQFTVGYANMADSDVFIMARKTALIAEVKGSDIALQFSDANADIQRQLDQADIFIGKKVNALVVVPVDSTGIVPAIKKANTANIPVICLGIKGSDGDFTNLYKSINS